MPTVVQTAHTLNSLNGGSSSSGVFVYKQLSPNINWNIIHNLGYFPSVTIVSSGGNIVIGDVKYMDNNRVIVSFTAAFSGKAYFS